MCIKWSIIQDTCTVVSLKFNKCAIILNMTLSTGKYFTDKNPLSYLYFISFMSNWRMLHVEWLCKMPHKTWL